ncbi:MAG: polysaccharide deacetylase family protein [Gammaproteobacteria bacterium]|nr:polysaccharide deacetylase family protein [Gammaproteobacteria bacterium]
MTKKSLRSYWPNKAKLAISISMQFEAGGQPDRGVESPFSGTPLPSEYPDLPAQTWFEYGYLEGIPRLLELWDKYDIKVTSHMVGKAVLANPDLAKEIVKRGHEAAAHGMSWESQYNMKREQEKKFIADGVKAIQKVTGVTAVGYNCNWLRRSVNTIEILQALGFLYHIDDVSRDHPFIIQANKHPFVVVPYTLRCNDIVLFEGRHFSPDNFFQTLKYEFDQLYSEGNSRQRMMSISTHDRIGGTPSVVKALDKFLDYASKHRGIWFARKDEIANWTLKNQ